MVTWDVDGKDTALCSSPRRFVFGYKLCENGRSYKYPGFVEREGVMYLGQSVVLADVRSLAMLQSFLDSKGIDHVIVRASIDSIVER